MLKSDENMLKSRFILPLCLFFYVKFNNFAASFPANRTNAMQDIQYIGARELDFVRTLRKEDGFFVGEGFLFAYRTLRPLLPMATGPFHSSEMRLLRVTSGEARYIVNLVVYDLHRGDILLMPANSLIEIVWYDDDFNAQFILFAIDVEVRDMGRLIKLSPADFDRTGLYMDLIWLTVQQGGTRRDTLRHLTDTLIDDIMEVDLLAAGDSRRDAPFTQFLKLVNQYSQQERSPDFYAERLAMTAHYLSAYISRVSGRTFTQWITFSLMQKARTQLRYTDKRISEISLDMGFENASDFSRFFKKQTGMTPNEYRNS